MRNRSIFFTTLVLASLLVLACYQTEQVLSSHTSALIEATDTAVFAVNCGGSSYTSSDGTEYLADTGYSGGLTYSNTVSISGTTDETLYQSERYGDSTYSVAVPNGLYLVNLHFAETFHTGVEARLFDVLMEETEYISDLDLYAEAGGNAAYITETYVTVSDGELNIEFVTNFENAKINAIKVSPAGFRASFSYSPDKPLFGQTTNFDASASTDPDGTITAYAWDFGDGSSGTGQTTAHTFSQAGDYEVTLTVTNHDGDTASRTKTVTVYTGDPLGDFSYSPEEPLVDQTIDFDASASLDPGGTITTYAWDFGDGNSGAGQTTTHAYSEAGDYQVTLTVTDNDGNTESVSKTVAVFIGDPDSDDWVNGNLILFNDNGGWCWYQDERVIVDTERDTMIIGSVASGGDRSAYVEIVNWDFSSQQGTRAHLATMTYPDDHDTPAIIQTPNGGYAAMWAGHNDDCNSYYSVYDGSSWSSASAFDWSSYGCPTSTGKRITYSNMWYLDDMIYSFVRSVDTSPHYLYSSDHGASWNFGGRLTSTPQVGYVAGYYKYWGNNSDRIDFLGTEAHPRDNDNSLYHGYRHGASNYNSFGDVIDSDATDDSAQNIHNYTRVFTTGTTINGVKLEHAWNADLVRYDDGTIAAIGSARVSDTGSDDPDKRLLYFRFDGSSWTTTYLARAGTKLYSSEQDYTGLGALDPNDPRVIYISTPYNPNTDQGDYYGKKEIWKGITCDAGASFTWKPVTANSSVDNLRPVVPKWNKDNTALLWMRGTYYSAQNYDTDIVGVVYENPYPVCQGTEPSVNPLAHLASSANEVGLLLANRFSQQELTFDSVADLPGDGYKTACEWYGSLGVAGYTSSQSLLDSLVSKFEPLKNNFIGAMTGGDPHVDRYVFGIVPLEIYLRTGDTSYLPSGTKTADAQQLTNQTRDAIDDMFMMTGLQLQAYRATRDAKYIDFMASTMVDYLSAQQDNGLFFHNVTQAPVHWGRGNGWFAAGMAEMIRDLPQEHAHYQTIVDGYKKMMQGLLSYQSANGLWYQVLDMPNHLDNWEESSSTAMFTYAMVVGVRRGVLEAETYTPVIEAAWQGLQSKMSPQGDVSDICVGTWYHDTPEEYMALTRLIGDGHGQAPVLWLAAELLR